MLATEMSASETPVDDGDPDKEEVDDGDPDKGEQMEGTKFKKQDSPVDNDDTKEESDGNNASRKRIKNESFPGSRIS